VNISTAPSHPTSKQRQKHQRMQTDALEINPLLVLSGIEKKQQKYYSTAALGGFCRVE